MIGQILEAILGGGQAAPQSGSQGSDPLAEILSGVLGEFFKESGGSGAAGASPLPEIGNVPGNLGGNPLLAPLTEELSERLGISPQMASTIMSLAFTLFMGYLAKMRNAWGDMALTPDELDLSPLLNQDFLQRSGAVDQLARQTGLPPGEAMQSLLQALGLIGEQQHEPPPAKPVSARPQSKPASARPPARPVPGSELQHLLDEWD